MDVRALLTQVQFNIEATCDRVTRQVSLIETRERNGLPTDHERNVLRGMRVSLGFEYHQEGLLLAALSREAEDEDRAAPARRACHRGAGEDCPLPVRCCATLAATVKLPSQAA
ncbi:hypothetical protein [Methylobacterium frigidaeris]|uniref:Uncharacterized protein n=1 Tax=Methylobacterium frigidaeris TaxID=2038277 RepID=A0AA37H789_9HYPH|nr:hypothetical protein [Methylobacterium frigidaeris]PIK74419.1 hypothetical protein CS379_02595 [Methylobacterium frigidaeris]GJD60575.1 hypothetical protein MPEAHAMD_0714 [Methylobacterium frigidaeris]